MMKFLRIASVVIFIIGVLSADAQSIVNYGFTTNATASLTDMSSGTTELSLASATLPNSVYHDDDATPVTSFGNSFVFYFMGQAYDRFSMNSNGQMKLGNATDNTAIAGTSITGPATGTAYIAPFSGDNALQPTGKVHYKVTGSFPNRIAIVEWVGMRFPYASSPGAGTPSNMQVRLYESSGIVEYAYGIMYYNSGTATRSIGLSSGNTATTSTYIASIITTPTNTPATTWPTTTFTTAASMPNLNGASDGSRRIFSWTPANTPTVPSTMTFTSVGFTGITVNWSDASTNEQAFAVYRSSDAGTTWVYAGTTASTTSAATGGAYNFAATGLAPATSYQWRVYAVAEGKYSATPLTGTQSTASCASGISGTKSVGPSGDYATLTAALAAINSGGISAPVTLELNASYTSGTETFPIVLNNSSCLTTTNRVTIRPASGATSRVITSANTTATIDVNGGSFYTIDGRPGGTGSLASTNLSIANTSTATGGTAIRFINDAAADTVRFANLSAQYGSTSSGVVNFSTSASGLTGNDNIAILNNNINAGALAYNGIYASGTTTSTALNNSGVSIANNNIYDFFVAGGTVTNGISVSSGNTDWSISGNSIYQTAARTYTSGATHSGININNTSGNNFLVSGNYVGGNTSSAGGTAYTMSGSTSRFTAISLAVGTTTASSVQGNTIANISLTTTSGVNTVPGVFSGIYINGGNVNIGNVTSNTIGSGTGTGSISLTTSTTGALGFGICIGSSATVNVSNNIIGSVNLAGNAAAVSHSFAGINVATATTATINNNMIGSRSAANSISYTTAGTGTTVAQIIGITSAATAATINNNMVANLSSAYVPASTNSGNILRGIYVTSGVAVVNQDTVYNLSTAASTSGTGTAASIIGIGNATSTAGNCSISQNIVHSLANTNASTAGTVTGIYFWGASTGIVTVAKNLIHSLNASSTTATINGINIGGSQGNFQNNMIRLGVDASGAAITTACAINGILETSGTDSIRFNSIYIGGTGVGTTASNTYALNSTVTSSTREYRNNIFMNARSNASTGGKHYGIRVGGTAANPAGLTTNYNNVFVNGTGGTFGFFNSLDVASMAAWRTATGQDANSINADPLFTTPNGTSSTLNLHVANTSPVDLTGVAVASVTDDYDGEARSGLSPTDIGADAFLGPACTGTPTAGTIGGNTPAICVSGSKTLTLSGQTSGAGISYRWLSRTTPTGAYTALDTNTTQPTGTITATTYYRLVVTCTSNSATDTSAQVAVTINAAPAVAISPATATVCGTTGVQLTASGGTSYSWSPSTGLSATNVANPTATPTSTTTYTVTATDGNGCTATTSRLVTYSAGLSAVTASASPNSVCAANPVTLTASASETATLLTQNFESGLGSWTKANASSGGVAANADWTIRAHSYLYSNIPVTFNSPGGTNFLLSNSDEQGTSGITSTTITSPAINTTGYTSLLLAYRQYFRYVTGDSVVVEVSTNNTVWDKVQSFSSTQGSPTAFASSSIALNAYINQSTLYIRFRYKAADSYYWALDDIALSGGTSDSTRFTYSWSSAPAGFTAATKTAVASPSVNTAYTVTITSVASGCTATANASVTIASPGALSAGLAATASSTTTVCSGRAVRIKATATGGCPPYTYNFGAGAGSIDSFNIASPATGTYYVTITENGGTTAVASVAVTVNPLPTAAITPSTALVCGTVPATLTASGGTQYRWSVDGSASVTALYTNSAATTAYVAGANQNPVYALPAASTIYRVTVTDGNGCTASTTRTVSLAPALSATATATPNSFCLGGTSQLLVTPRQDTVYTVTSIANAPLTAPGSGVTTLATAGAASVPLTYGDLDDGAWNNITLPFSFNFYGSNFSAVSIGVNGAIAFGTDTMFYAGGRVMPTAAAPNRVFAALWSDLYLINTGTVRYWSTGVSPNRKFVVEYQGVEFYDDLYVGGFGSGTFQAILNENGSLESHITSADDDGSYTYTTIGVENATGTVAVTAPGVNDAFTADLVFPQAWRFTQSVPTFTYAWSPGATLSATNIANPTATPTATTAYSVTVTSNSGCSVVLLDTVTISAGAPSVAVTASNSPYCAGDSTNLTATITGGCSPYTYAWSGSLGATQTVKAKPTTTTSYTVTITDVNSNTASASFNVVVNNPQPLTTVPGTRCGTGAVTLGATANTGDSIRWYAAASGGVSIARGGSYTTPVISSSTTYYVGVATSSAAQTAGLGGLGSYGTQTTGVNDWPIRFNVSATGTLVSADVYATAAGTVVVALRNSLSTTDLFTTTATISAGQVNSLVTIPLNWYISTAGSYQLTTTSASTGNIARYSPYTGTYPFTAGALSIVGSAGGSSSATVTTQYNSFFNLRFASECAGTRVAVAATISAPPTLTTQDSLRVCNNAIGTLSITSNTASFDTFRWSPVTNLYTDAAATVPYVAGTSRSTVYVKGATAGATTYVVTGVQAGGSLCVNTDTVAVRIQPAVTGITNSNSSICVSGTSVIALTPSTGYAPGSIQWYSSTDSNTFNIISGATSASYTTPTLNSGPNFYRAIVSASGTCATQTVRVNVTSPSVVSTTPGVRCGAGTVNLKARGSAGTSIEWYAGLTGGTLLRADSLYTTPSISTTTNYYAVAKAGGGKDVGAGALTGTGVAYDPFNGGYGGMKGQYLFTAAELSAAGLSAGNITSLAFDVTATGSVLSNFSVQIGNTALTDFVTPVSIASGLTTVYNPATFTSVVGMNTIVFTTPFNWNGSSNIIVQTNWSNVNSSNTSATVKYDNTTNYSSQSYREDNAAATAILAITGAATGSGANTRDRSQSRPKISFNYTTTACYSTPRTTVVATISTPPAITPVANAASICVGQSSNVTVSSTNAGYTYAWSNGSLPGTVSPATTTKYYVTATDATGGAYGGCVRVDSVTLTVNTLPATPTLTPAATSVCAGDVVKLNASGSAVANTTSTTATGTISVAIPDNTATGAVSSQLVSGIPSGATISAVRVRVNVTHNFVDDLELNIKAPNGNILNLINNQGSNGNLTNTVFSSASAALFTLGSAPYTGTFGANASIGAGPTGFISNAAGFSSLFSTPNGSWSLAIVDNAAIGAGTLTSWTLEIDYSAPAVYTWSPTGSLYTNAAGTTAYTGTARDSVYAKPTATTLYTVTATNGAGCTATASATINVTAKPTVYAGGSGSGCSLASYTVSGDSVSSQASSFVWTHNGTGSIAATSSLHPVYTPGPGESGLVKLILTATPTAPCLVNVTDTFRLTLSSVCASSTWTGATSSAWGNSSNWNPGLVPNSCSVSVTIPGGTPNQPVISGADYSVGNVTIAGGVTLTLNSNNLNVCGNWTGGTGIDAVSVGSGRVILNSVVSQQVLAGKTTFDSLRLDNALGCRLAGNTSVYIGSVLELKAGTFNTNQSPLVFKSIAANQAAVLDNFSAGFTGTISGGVSAQRYYETPTGTYSQHYMSSPVNSLATGAMASGSGSDGVFITPLANCDETQLDPATNYGNVFDYNESNVTFCYLEAWRVRSSGNLTNGRGYSVRKNGTGTLTISGNTNLGSNYDQGGLTNSNWSFVSLQGNTSNSGWHLIGNPYQALLDPNSANTGSFDNNGLVLHTTGPFAGTYQPLSMTSSNTIAPFQAMMVHKTTIGGTATFNIGAGDRRTGQTNFYKNAEHQMSLTVGDGTRNDITYVDFMASATNDYDPMYDGYKFGSFDGSPTLYTNIGSDLASVNANPDVASTPVIPMGFVAGANKMYTITAAGIEDLPVGTIVTLEDKQNGTLQVLNNAPQYSFSATTNDAKDRFNLLFSIQEETPNAIVDVNEMDIRIFSSENRVIVDLTKLKEVNATISIYNLLGAELSNEKSNGGVYSKALQNFEVAYVLVTVRNGNNITTKKLFINNAK